MDMKMNKRTVAGTTVVVVCIAVLLISGYGGVRRPPVATAFVTPVETPSSIRFCGQEIDLSRYNMHEGVDRELNSFMYYHSTVMLLIKRANRYFPLIEPVLKANGIPDDFKYLAVIESHLDPLVASPARAVGLWQLLEGTGKQYGLRVTASVDERCHVVKSTEAACKYLKEAYGKYGDWATVASSYNAGMGRISEQLARQQQTSSLNLHLVEETLRYPYRIFAVKLIFENPYKYGFILKPQHLYRPVRCREILVEEDIPDLAAYAREYGLAYCDLKYFNPWLKDSKLMTGGGKYVLLIPDKKDLYYETANTCVHDRRWIAPEGI
jgi:hypothetical protein